MPPPSHFCLSVVSLWSASVFLFLSLWLCPTAVSVSATSTPFLPRGCCSGRTPTQCHAHSPLQGCPSLSLSVSLPLPQDTENRLACVCLLIKEGFSEEAQPGSPKAGDLVRG